MLFHWSHVLNVSNIFPLVKDSFEGKYTGLDFSKNIAMKPKFEVQDAHFIGKQYALHYVVIEPGEQKYVYHLSDDSAVHDPLSLSIKCYKIS